MKLCLFSVDCDTHSHDGWKNMGSGGHYCEKPPRRSFIAVLLRWVPIYYTCCKSTATPRRRRDLIRFGGRCTGAAVA